MKSITMKDKAIYISDLPAGELLINSDFIEEITDLLGDSAGMIGAAVYASHKYFS